MDTAVEANLTFDARHHKRTTSSVLKSIIGPRGHHRNQSRDQQFPVIRSENVNPNRHVVPGGKPIPSSRQDYMGWQVNEGPRNRDMQRSSPTKPIEVYEDITKPLDVHKKGKSSLALKSLMGGEKGLTAEEKLAKKQESTKPKKSKSSTSLSALLSRSKSSKDLSSEYELQQKDKENQTPPRNDAAPPPPIWAQFTTQPVKESTTSRKVPLNDLRDINDEMALYTPRNYSPSKQRNFHDYQQPNLSRKPEPRPRPRSAILPTDSSTASFVETLSKLRNLNKSQPDSAQQQNLQSRKCMENGRRSPSDNEASHRKLGNEPRKVSNETSKSAATVGKRGSRVMAVVAAFNGKAKESAKEQARDVPNTPLDDKAIENAFESLLDSRNVPQQTRDKMRGLDTNIKADLLKQDRSGSGSSRKADESSPLNLDGRATGRPLSWGRSKTEDGLVSGNKDEPGSAAANDSPRKSRPRSRTFTLTKGGSSSKKQKSERPASRGRPKSTDLTPLAAPSNSLTSSATAQALSFVTKLAKPVGPEEYIDYLRKVQMPASVEVGKMQKLRQVLRNETVGWVDDFMTRGGMEEIVGLLYRIIKVEWREEHEDMLLHETLLCLKALCTTSLALDQLSAVQSTLFPVLLAMLFDGEKKGPSEFTTRNIITSLLFTYLCTSPPSDLTARARTLLSYLRDPSPPEASQPPGFIASMHRSRPYRLWSKEMTNVTKEVFWIFIHHSNIIPYTPDADAAGQSYTANHFPRERPPVAAAPYVGGVEWDATNYLTSHLDLINGIIASLPTSQERNDFRRELKDCGMEKCFGVSWRTCKEKFYGAVHIGLATWIGAAAEDGWDIRFVKEGPRNDEVVYLSPKKRRGGGDDGPPKLNMLNLDLGGSGGEYEVDGGGWL